MSGTIRDGASIRDVAAESAPDPAPRDSAHVLLASLREEANVERIVQGASWIVAVVRGTRGQRAAGMAGIPHGMRGRCCVPGQPALDARPERAIDVTTFEVPAAHAWARLLLAQSTGEAAVGLAVTNALLALNPEAAAPVDGVDWLLARTAGRDVAVIGAFPFVDRELRPIARKVWVFEREPGEGELGEAEAPAILPQADVVVITAGALANHTLDALLHVTGPHAVRMLLGPSTPLTSALFAFGFDALSGVRVTDIDAVIRDVAAGVGFRRMAGLERVTLLRNAETM